MLPVEMWREVLGFCPFDDYLQLVGLRRVERETLWGRCQSVLQWHSRTSSREFYFLLKLSMLEMRFHKVLPSASLGGLWVVSRDPETRYIRKLRLGRCSLVFFAFFSLVS